MRENLYYSRRTSKKLITLETLSEILNALYDKFIERDYFQEAFKHIKVDGARDLIIETGKNGLWPIHLNRKNYKEDDVFDVIEFLFDIISKPIPSDEDYWTDGEEEPEFLYINHFDKELGQHEFQKAINQVLCDYGNGYVLDENGEIHANLESGLETLFNKELPNLSENELIQDSVDHAKKK